MRVNLKFSGLAPIVASGWLLRKIMMSARQAFPAMRRHRSSLSQLMLLCVTVNLNEEVGLFEFVFKQHSAYPIDTNRAAIQKFRRPLSAHVELRAS